MKIIGYVAAVLIVILLFPFASDGAKNMRQTTYTQTAPFVTTGAVNTANIALAKALFQSDVVSVSLITSNSTSDAPAATSYNPTGRLLTVDGLADNSTRNLSITYTYQRQDNNTDGLLSNFDLFLILGILAIVGIGVYDNRKKFH